MTDQPRQHAYRMTFEPIAFTGDYVELINPGAGSPHIVAKVLGYLPLGEIEADFGAPNNGVAVGPYEATVSAAGVGADQLVVGTYEFCQARIYLEPRDFAVGYPGANAYLQAYAQGSSQLMWATQNAQGRWDPYMQNLFPDLAPSEIFWYYNQTPQFKVTNNSGGNLAHTRAILHGFHYWYIDQTAAYDDVAGDGSYGPRRRRVEVDIAQSVTKHIIPVTLGPLGTSSVPGAIPH